MIETDDFNRRLERLDSLVHDAEQASDPAILARWREIVQTILDLHGLGLERALAHVNEAGAAGHRILDDFTRDQAVAGMLLLHDLHPVGLEQRVRQALEDVRPALRAHGGNVELLGLDEATVYLKLNGNCDGCPSSAVTMKQTVEEAILARAPEIMRIEVEGLVTGLEASADDDPSLAPRLALPLV